MNTLVSLGALASFGMSTVAVLVPKLGWPTFFEEPVMLMAFVLLGRAVEERAKLKVCQLQFLCILYYLKLELLFNLISSDDECLYASSRQQVTCQPC